VETRQRFGSLTYVLHWLRYLMPSGLFRGHWRGVLPFLHESKNFRTKMAHFEPKTKKIFREGTAPCPDPSRWKGTPPSPHLTVTAPPVPRTSRARPQGRHQVKKCGVDTHGERVERAPIMGSGGRAHSAQCILCIFVQMRSVISV